MKASTGSWNFTHDQEDHVRHASIRLTKGAEQAVVAELVSRDRDRLIFHPLAMGRPWLYPKDQTADPDDAIWWSYSMGEVFIEDIDELAKAADVPSSDDWKVMEHISEAAFKQCLAEILFEEAPKDWGGEQSDLYSAHIHLGGRRTTAAFLLPA